ncbi:MAG: DUF4389 domain-containing protein [Gammaproteobacteria bacterium]|nr:DUF4389 domain-containing protein [Gammaproteobacteria bacterium]
MTDSNPPADDALMGDEETGKPVEGNIKSRATWTRFLFMVLSFILVYLAAMVGVVIVVFGFLWVLFTGEVNHELRGVGQSIASYIYENVRFLTFNTDERPFPFGGEWPSAEADAD